MMALYFIELREHPTIRPRG